MAEQSAEQIIPFDFAEAFADAVLVYEIWSPEYPGREIRIGPRFYSIIEVCGFVDQFTDRLPERVFLKLRSYRTTIQTASYGLTLRPILYMQQRLDVSAK
jgi:hypothetical protein